MSFVRIFFLLLTWASYLAGFTKPAATSSVQSHERVKASEMHPLVRPINMLTTSFLPLRKVLLTIVICVEIISDIVSTYPTASLSHKLSFLGLGNSIHPYLSSGFYIGASLAIAGALIRIACFRELGRLFTYELSIRDNHKLITSGPYALARHPSYVGAVLLAAGVTIAEVSPGSWWTEAHVMDTTLGQVVAGLWALSLVLVTTLLARAPKEDEMLRGQFGAQWEVYARQVQWWFVPGVI